MRNKINQIVLAIITVAFAILFSSSLAHADYKINQFKVNVDLTPDGNANVTQTVKYKFGADYHGVFNNQDLRGIKGAKLESVKVKGDFTKWKEVKAANTGAENTYKLTQNANQMQVKVYHSVEEYDNLTVAYQYRLLGIVTNYLDTAELNWKVIGAGWDVPLENVQVQIQLPATNISKLQAWAHGPLDGKNEVDKKDGRVQLNLDENPANSFVETHLLFPTSVTPKNTNKVKQNHLKAAQAQEAKLAKQANDERNRHKDFFMIGGIISALVGVGGLMYSGWWFTRNRYNRYQKPIPMEHSFDIPTVSPAVAQAILRNGKPTTDGLSAEILVQASQKNVVFSEEKVGWKKKKSTTKITRLNDTGLSFLEQAFQKLGNDDSFTLIQLKTEGKRSNSHVSDWYEEWQTEVENKTDQFKDKQNINYRHHLRNMLIMTIVMALITTIIIGLGFGLKEGLLVAGIGGLISIAVAGWFGLRWKQVSEYNQAGLEQRNQIQAFKQMLKDIAHFNTAEIGDLILWEQILPYATAFDLADRVAQKLRIDFGDQLNRDVPFYPYYFSGYSLGLSNSLSSSLGSALSSSVASSSVGGASGGFSGGSSGGFGGGSGGGAF